MGTTATFRALPGTSVRTIERIVSMKRMAQAALFLGVGLLAWFIFTLYIEGEFKEDGKAFVTSAKDLSSFVAVFFSLASIFLVLENLKVQGRLSETNMLLTQKSHFEKTFFDLIALQNQIARDIDTEVEDGVPVKGRGFFDDIADRVTEDYDNGTARGREALVRVYRTYSTVHNSDMAHYYRNLYNIVRYVADHPYFSQLQGRPDLNLMDRRGYLRILRAQLTNAEITCLALNGMCTYGATFGKLIEEHHLLQNLDFELTMPPDYLKGVPDPEVIAECYPHLRGILSEQRATAATTTMSQEALSVRKRPRRERRSGRGPGHGT